MAGITTPIPKWMMRLQGVKYGKDCKFYGIPVIVQKWGSRISLGENVMVNSGFLSNMIGLYQRTMLIARDGGEIEIADRVGMSGVTVYAREKIKIGADTLIGANTKIFDNDFHPINPEMRRMHPTAGAKCKPIEIGENVLIGCNCIILKGVTIGDNTTIGAGSVVTRGIPANCIAAGNPAKVIRRLTGEENDKNVR